MSKTMTVRLSDEQARELETVARIDEMPVAEAVRRAIDDRIKVRREDNDFQTRLRRLIQENQEALERLAK
jgi:predicted transcriptional regulator